MKKILSLVIIVAGIVVDQLFKNWIVSSIPYESQKTVINGLLSLTYLKNNGAAWSILQGQQWLFNILTPIAVLVALYFLWRKNSELFYNIALSLIVAGALGNFIDRLRQGFVVDMFQLDFINFPIFNIADSMLSIGFVVLILAIILDKND